jgi:serine/threonine protein kinase
MIDDVIGGKFHRINLIGQGNFGRVYLARNLEDNSFVAIKVELGSGRSFLENEKTILTQLRNCAGIPKLIQYGEAEEYKYMILQLLGPSLEDKFIENQKKFPFTDFINYSTQLLKVIESIHMRDIIHRDIKPRQILLGPASNKDQLYLMDFGISMKYKDNGHVPYSQNCGFAGTCNYCSVYTHLGIQQSRRDDLESFCYVLAYFYTGTLPWMLPKMNDSEVFKIKESVTGKDLFGKAAKDLVDVFKYIKQLKFEDEPNYDYIRDKIYKHSEKFNKESRIYRQYSNVPMSKPKKIKKKFTFIEDTEEITLNLDTTIVSKGPEINRNILRKY